MGPVNKLRTIICSRVSEFQGSNGWEIMKL